MAVELRHAGDGTPFLVGIDSLDQVVAGNVLLMAHLSRHAPHCAPCAVWRQTGLPPRVGPDVGRT